MIGGADGVRLGPRSHLVLGRSGGRALHVVLAENHADDELIVVTVYEPDPALWRPGFRRRRER